MPKIKYIKAEEILDSRGNPTLQTTCTLEGGFSAAASVPSGASTGAHEAHELRDNDPQRYDGKGVLKAIENVNTTIAQYVYGKEFTQENLDQTLLNLDGTQNKEALGANAILSVSLSFARACAQEKNVELYEYIASMFLDNAKQKSLSLPQPAFNVINGGKHSDSGIPFQEFMLIPVEFKNIKEKIQVAKNITETLKKILTEKGYSTAMGDEGGFAPKLISNEEALDILMEAIEASGYSSNQVKIGIDSAATSFFKDGKYILNDQILNTEKMLNLYEVLANTYPIVSIEDGLQEEDFVGFTELNKRLGGKMNIVGDDLTVTNVPLLQKAIEQKSINTVLIKLNQIGTLTETLNAMKMAKENGIKTFVSHRSGETLDTFIADLAVGTNADFIKAGAPTKEERLAKYNRLIEIENILENKN